MERQLISKVQEADIWYDDCSHKYNINQGLMVSGRRPSVENNLRWKTSVGGRRPSVEHIIKIRVNFNKGLVEVCKNTPFLLAYLSFNKKSLDIKGLTFLDKPCTIFLY